MSADTESDRSERDGQVVEPWQAPNLNQPGGSAREIWEYENEATAPSKNLIIITVLVLAGCLVGLALVLGLFYYFMR